MVLPPLRTAALACLVAAPAAALEEITDFGPNPGDLRMFLHRPATSATNLPLVVALHGCTQRATDFDDETGLVTLAEETPFLLLLPEQDPANMFNRCFRWYDSADNLPDAGESASLRAMIDFALGNEPVDPDRVYVLGLSAGGAMTAVLLANYPDRFAGGAIFAGLPYGCNRPFGPFDFGWRWLALFGLDGAEAAHACGIGEFSLTDRTSGDWADFVRDAGGSEPVNWPLLSLWQGGGDETVDPDNLTELLEQWTALHGIDTVPEVDEMLDDATRAVFHDAGGTPRIETWTLPTFGHAVPIDADGAPAPCGSEGSHVKNADLCAVRRVLEFWGLE